MNDLSSQADIAIIGAGIAGLACAQSLTAAGHRVTLFDKGRSPGGRIATRRSGNLLFDHGAQFATARGAAFVAEIQELRQSSAVVAWLAARAEEPAWIGTPGMSAIPRAMSDQLVQRGARIESGRHVAFVTPDRRLRLLDAQEAKPGTVANHGGTLTDPFDAVLLALPSPQAGPLLAAMGHDFAAIVSTAVYAPCWALMLHYAGKSAAPDILRPSQSPLAWIARDSARPGRAVQEGESWVLHASAEWSRAHLEEDAATVSTALLAEFRALTGQSATPAETRAHRWRYALVETALGTPCLWDAATRIGACGDYCLGGRVEAAFDSGRALAASVIGSVG